MMSLGQAIGGKMVGGAVAHSVIGAAVGAGSAALGTTVLLAAGHTGYQLIESVLMTSLGSGLLGLLTGALSGVFAVFNEALTESQSCNKNIFVKIVTLVGKQVLGGLIGFGIFYGLNMASTDMQHVVASAAVGAAILAIPVIILLSIVVTCCALGIFVTTPAEDCEENNDLRNARAWECTLTY